MASTRSYFEILVHGASPAADGAIRFTNADEINWDSALAAAGQVVKGISVSSADKIVIGDDTNAVGTELRAKTGGNHSLFVNNAEILRVFNNAGFTNFDTLTRNAIFDTGAAIYWDMSGINVTHNYRGTGDVTVRTDTMSTAGVASIIWGAESTSITYSQTKRVGTGANVGAPLIISAQDGQNVSGGTNNNGGLIQIKTGAVGTGGTGGVDGVLEYYSGSTLVATWQYSSSIYQVNVPTVGGFQFATNTAASLTFYNVNASGSVGFYARTINFGNEGVGVNRMAMNTQPTTTFIFDSTTTSVAYSITQRAGTGTNIGASLSISAQSGQLQTGGANNNNGGALILRSGTAGTGGSGSAASDGTILIGTNDLDLVGVYSAGGASWIDAGVNTTGGNSGSRPLILKGNYFQIWGQAGTGYIDCAVTSGTPIWEWRGTGFGSVRTDTLRPAGASSMAWASGVTSVTWSHTKLAGTGANAGAVTTFSAQDGQDQTGGAANNNGGDLAFKVGAAGTGGAGAAGANGFFRFYDASTETIRIFRSGANTFIENMDSGTQLAIRHQNNAILVSSSSTITFTCGGTEQFTSSTTGLTINWTVSGGLVRQDGLQLGAVGYTHQPTVTGITWTQTKRGGTGANVGATFTLQSQDGQDQSGAVANNNGGDLAYKTGAAGTGGEGAAATDGKHRYYSGATEFAQIYKSGSEAILAQTAGMAGMRFSGTGGQYIVTVGGSIYNDTATWYWRGFDTTLRATWSLATAAVSGSFSETCTSVTFTQDTRTTDADCGDIIIKSQQPYATATGTNRTPGRIVLDSGTPTNASTTYGTIDFKWSGSVQMDFSYNPTDGVIINNAGNLNFTSSGGSGDSNIAFHRANSDWGSASQVLYIGSTENPPTNNPSSDGIYLWADGCLKARNPNGGVYTIIPEGDLNPPANSVIHELWGQEEVVDVDETILTYTLPDQTSCDFMAEWVAIRTDATNQDHTASARRRTSARRIGSGTLTIVGTDTIGTDKADAGVTMIVTVDTDGSNTIRFRARVAAGQTVLVACRVKFIQITRP